MLRIDAASNRCKSVTYSLTGEDRTQKNVRKVFFLLTLGYGPASSVVAELLHDVPIGSPVPNGEQRGGKRPSHVSDRDGIIAHINSFNPSLPHYCRALAPNRRYLPSELSVRFMLNDYDATHPAVS